MGKTAIEWTEMTWNPVVGCTPVSAGCKNCYARTLHDRRHKAFLEGKKLPAQYAKPFGEVQIMYERFDQPIRWQRPRMVFVNSVSDLFHEQIPFDEILQIYQIMALANEHTFEVLTKRALRMAEFYRWIETQDTRFTAWPLPNVWLIVSVEDQPSADERIPILLQTPAAVRGISAEPLLGPVDIHRSIFGYSYMDRRSPCPPHFSWIKGHGLDWVICGGESGKNARPMHPDWARSLRDQCVNAGVPFFFKQWGEWLPVAPQYSDDDDANLLDNLDLDAHQICLGNSGTIYSEDLGRKKEYWHFWCGYQPDPGQNPWYLERVGKKAAGRLLDGRTWDEYPKVE